MTVGTEAEAEDTPLNISFSGCGFLGIYHVGVIQCLRDNAPSLIPRFKIVAGASAGAIASLVLLSNCPAERVCKGFIETSEASRRHWIGPLSTSFDIMAVLDSLFDDLLPPQAHRLCQGRLQVSLTSMPDMTNFMASNFNTRMELIKVHNLSHARSYTLPVTPPTTCNQCIKDIHKPLSRYLYRHQ